MIPTIYNGFKNKLISGYAKLLPSSYIYASLFNNLLSYSADMDYVILGGHYLLKDPGERGEQKFYELTGEGYVPGGILLSNVTLTERDDLGKVIFDANDVVFPGVTLVNVRYVALYSPNYFGLLGVWDMGVAQNPVNEDLIIKWNPNGILEIA